MAVVKISQLPAAGAAGSTDQLEVNQGGFSRRVTVSQVVASALPLTGGTVTGNLAVTGEANVVGNITTNNGLSVLGNAGIGGGVTITGNLGIGAGLTVEANAALNGSLTTMANDAISAGSNGQAFIKASTTVNLGIYYGTGAPTFSAAKGSLYSNTTATTTTTRLYVNTDGATAWATLTTSA